MRKVYFEVAFESLYSYKYKDAEINFSINNAEIN